MFYSRLTAGTMDEKEVENWGEAKLGDSEVDAIPDVLSPNRRLSGTVAVEIGKL